MNEPYGVFVKSDRYGWDVYQFDTFEKAITAMMMFQLVVESINDFVIREVGVMLPREGNMAECPDCDGEKVLDAPCTACRQYGGRECMRCGNSGLVPKTCGGCGGTGMVREDPDEQENKQQADGRGTD